VDDAGGRGRVFHKQRNSARRVSYGLEEVKEIKMTCLSAKLGESHAPSPFVFSRHAGTRVEVGRKDKLSVKRNKESRTYGFG